jgi:hypothetical protein
MGFSGTCFDAMSIIALYRRCLEQLVFVGDTLVRPEPVRLLEILQEITNRWFKESPTSKNVEVYFLVFGYSPIDGRPWAGKVGRGRAESAKLIEISNPLEPQEFYCAGDVGERRTFKRAIDDIRKRIQRHAKRLRPGNSFDARMAQELEAARHESADKKSIEKLVFHEIRKASNETVGGVVQKLEVVLSDNYSCVAAFSRDDQDYILDNLPPAANGLTYVPVVEKMAE